MSKFNVEQKIGDIVASLPKASEVFMKYHIDFCCGGNRPLSQAIKEQHLDETEILNKISEAYEEAAGYQDNTDYTKMTRNELINYIVNTHHIFTRTMLQILSELTAKILRVHGQNHKELNRVYELFHLLQGELEQHLKKEEELFFPLIKEFDNNKSELLRDQIIHVMEETENEHEAAGDILKELRKVTDDFSVPEDGCATFRLTYDKLQELETDLFQHIHLENNILFHSFS